MPSYAIIDSNNIVQNIIYFETEPDDITPFIDSHAILLEKSDLSHVKITDQHRIYNIGHIYSNDEFRPPQPYPSWKWDSDKLIWRPPVVHPDIWPSTVDSKAWGNYTWDGENKTWLPIQ